MQTSASAPRREPRYPIGIQNFEKLREGGYVYVDKTHHIRRLIDMGNPYFLSRPRRFGKSLLLSTIEAYFQGKKHLFEGLAIAEGETEWAVHPVLHLDLNAEKYDDPKELEGKLNHQLSVWEKLYGSEPTATGNSDRFMTVIEKACLKTGKRVVVLIDEYDKPLLNSFHDEALQQSFRKMLTAFYSVLKTADQWLHFVLITGVTKFAQMGIFSNLNQLKDISFNPLFVDICGMTRTEIERDFQKGLRAMAEDLEMTYPQVIDEFTRRYDGYHFKKNQTEGMFNPFSVLNALSDKIFDDYWFASGTPTFLVEMLKKTNYDLRELDGVEVSAASLSDDRADINNPIPMIYQSGYLTIKDYDSEFQRYTLGFPNNEVKYGFLNFAAPFYTPLSSIEAPFNIVKFLHELREGDPESFLKRLRAFFADFPYELNDKTERHYQVVLYLVFKLLGQFTEAEVRSARGRADAVVRTPDYIYLFEFKLDGDAQAALQQIDEKGYLIPYTADGRKVFKIGVNFDAQERNLGEWVIATLT
jgi:Protein of unknown function (DUF1703)./Predicted AAA-ATPase.